MTTTDTRPVAQELFRTTAAGPALLGSRCTGCGTHYFPKSLSCRNPACASKAVEEVELGRRGTLYSYTVQAYRPPALFRHDSWSPYAIGLVQLPEGLRVMAMITGCEPGDLRIDMPMEPAVAPLYTDEDDRAVVTYTYAPAVSEVRQ